MWFSNVANCGENEAYPTAYVIIYCFCLPTGLCMYICKKKYIYVRGGNGSFIFTLLCGVFVLRHSIEMVAFNKVESAIYIAVQRQCLKPLGGFVCLQPLVALCVVAFIQACCSYVCWC